MSQNQLSSAKGADKEKSMSATCPKVSIIILNWNSYEVTRDCLLSLAKIDYSNFEVVLVDNGSVDGSPDKLAQEFPYIRLFKNGTNLGFTGGNNVGLRDALARGTDYLLLLNNDTIVAPNFLSELVRVTEQEPSAGLANPKILYCEPANRIWYAGGAYKRGWGFAKHFGVKRIDKGQYDQMREVSFVTGCALLVKAVIAQRLGLLDDVLFLGFEDLDWCLRARDAGFKAFYVPTAVIWHKEGYDTKKNLGKPVKDFYYTRNSIIFARKHFRLLHWPYFLLSLAGHLSYRTAGYLARGEPERVKAVYRGLWNGCTTKMGQSGEGQVSAASAGASPANDCGPDVA